MDTTNATAHEPAPELLSAQEISKATAYLISTRDGLFQAVHGLDPAQWDFNPGTGQWSIAEILEHIVIVETRIHALIGNMKDAPLAEAGRNDAQIDEFVTGTVPDRSRKFAAPERLLPSRQFTPAENLERFDKGRAQTLQLLREAPSLRGRVAPHPVLGAWDGYQWILATAGHGARHTAQIQEVKSCPGFPGASACSPA